ncbi:aminomethyl-transferring glycine dehydrogenase subunit GcvPA [Fundicoccus culcitae]|uniref:Probable glycine dehydrogenase (decarboxylating) subunit 1 n=1 Tax=Fundicoccus culcitae TaxID=2969821 RepID=A0ABY5P6J6_9LACT|nr:aminomethyl-transferring glycine dehydrogenase subunit GcvPA [Fundicoccus culcitae]UUX34347.1 aminomethyl-transferring glycine dehydrogenase subunit GcvPA [Fundicoccus culcitae]
MSFSHRYLPITPEDRQEMLNTIGVDSIEDLFADIPSSVRLKDDLNLPDSLSEHQLVQLMKGLADKNTTASQMPYFLGAGTYDHFIPSVVNHVMLKSEFMTAYVPYQAEASQGELQALFEFQTMICELTGMEAANSSLYDGFTSLGEACNLAYGATKKSKVIISQGVHPQGIEVVNTYAYGMEYDVVVSPLNDTTTDLTALEALIDEDTAAVVVQYPNFFGTIEDIKAIKSLLDGTKALLIVVANPLALAVLEAPGKLGADIVVGDTQPLGIPMSYGGPHCGYFATTKQYMRKMPSRIVGETVDAEGKRGFVMTLQTREQHIRREKATSNMSSNQALYALGSAVFMSALGKVGLQEMAQKNINASHYLAQQLKDNGFDLVGHQPFFHEFVVKLNKPVKEVNDFILDNHMMSGLDVSSYFDEPALLLCATEKRSKEEIDQFVSLLKEAN